MGAVPIAHLQIGDLVLAWNEPTQTTGVYTVIDIIKRVDPLVVHVVIDGEAREITLAPPFYTVERGWVAATNLRPGEREPRRILLASGSALALKHAACFGVKCTSGISPSGNAQGLSIRARSYPGQAAMWSSVRRHRVIRSNDDSTPPCRTTGLDVLGLE